MSLKDSTSLQGTDRADPTGKSSSVAEVRGKQEVAAAAGDDGIGGGNSEAKDERRKRAELMAAAAERLV